MTQGGNVTTTTYTYDDADQLTSVNGTSYTYDANGNLISDGNRTYVYDAENRLIAVKDSNGNTIAFFTYRADGLRKTMTTASGTITFHYDENKNVTYETDQNGNVVASYTFNGNQPVSMTRNGQTYYYQLNGHGDVVALTDANGNTVATYEYDAFGNIVRETGTIENPYRYAGYRYDKETGLYYLQNRYYNPDTGRFLTRDTFDGFDTDPLSLNKYSYAKNNPVMNVDPYGYFAVRCGTLATIIDVAIIIFTGYKAYGTTKALHALIKQARVKLTRLIEGKMRRYIGSAAAKWVSTIINVALTIAGTSIRQMIANAIDRYLDLRLGYRKGNGWCFG